MYKMISFILVGIILVIANTGCGKTDLEKYTVNKGNEIDTINAHIDFGDKFGIFQTHDTVKIAVDSLQAKYLIYVYAPFNSHDFFIFQKKNNARVIIRKALINVFSIYDAEFAFEDTKIFTDRALMFAGSEIPFQTSLLELSVKLSTVPGDKNYQGPQRVVYVKRSKKEEK